MSQTRQMVPARWTNDCQGKKDFDGAIVSVSTRYWPRGGGFTLMRRVASDVEMEENDARPEIKPSAHCSILLYSGPPDEDGVADDEATLAERRFEGETFEAVAAEVESWAQTQYDRIVCALRSEFANTGPQPPHSRATGGRVR